MKKSFYGCVLFLGAFLALALPGCSGDDDATECDKAFDAWCACPMVTCMGRPSSCTGPDLTWAKCINAAEDVCSSNCTP